MPDGINPIYSSYFEIQTYIPTSSANLNLTQDTIDATTHSSVNIPLDSSNPNLSILGFSKLVSSALRENKAANDAFDLSEAGMYRDFHRNVAITTAKLREEIDALQAFNDTYNAFLDQLDVFNDTVQGRVDTLQNNYSDIQNQANFFHTWRNAGDAAFALNNTVTTTPEETQALLEEYALWVARYNTRAAQLNGDTNLSSTVLGINNYINNNKPDLQGTADTLNAFATQFGLTSPTVELIPSLDAFMTYPVYAPITINIPPPYPEGLYFDPLTDPRYYFDRGPIPYPPVDNFGQPVSMPLFPPSPTYTVPHKINHDVYFAEFIQPRLDMIEEMKRSQRRVENAIDFQQAFRPDFAQVAISASLHVPVGSPATGGSTVGSSNALSGLAANQGQNSRFDEQFGKAQLESLYNTLGVPLGSPLIANIDGYPEDILAALVDFSVPAGIQLSQGALVGGTPGESPAVGAALALATLENTLKLAGSDAIFKALFDPANPEDKGILLERALADPANKEKTEATLRAELEPLARGIAAAINLQLIKTAVLQVETAIGASGLLPQILANLGSVSTDSIVQFVNGLINYKHLFDSPRDTQLVALTLRDFLEDELALDRARSELIVGRALNEVARQGPFDTEEAAQTALREGFARSLRAENLEAAPLVDRAFDRLGLTPEQQLSNDLKAEAFLSEIKRELLRSHLEEGEAARIAARLDGATEQTRALEERRTVVEQILAEEGIDQGAAITLSATARVESPLFSGFITAVAPKEVLSADFGTAIAELFIHQGVRRDIANEQAEHFSDLVFNNPTSISSLVERNLNDYAKAVGITQTEAADATFRDTQQVRLSTSAYLAHIMNPAHALVFLSNPIIYGNLQPRVGPAGGVVTNPVISI